MTKTVKKSYSVGRNPNSLKNLRPHIPQIHDEAKTKSVSLMLTPTGKKGLVELAKMMNLSQSELIERIGRGLLRVVQAEN